jgi:hypothetical protein
MAHYAEITSGKVTNVIVIPNDQEHRAKEYFSEIGLTGNYVQTSYNANVRTRFAGVGDTYNARKDRFEPPKPMPSWKWDEPLYAWKTPVDQPTDGKVYEWNEATLAWEEEPNSEPEQVA